MVFEIFDKRRKLAEKRGKMRSCMPLLVTLRKYHDGRTIRKKTIAPSAQREVKVDIDDVDASPRDLQWRIARLRPQQSKAPRGIVETELSEFSASFSLLASALGNTRRRIWQRSSFSSTRRLRSRQLPCLRALRFASTTYAHRWVVTSLYFVYSGWCQITSFSVLTKLQQISAQNPFSSIFHANRCVCTFIEKSTDLLWSTVTYNCMCMSEQYATFN